MKKFVTNVCYFESLINSMKSLNSSKLFFETIVEEYCASIVVKFELTSQCVAFYSFLDSLFIQDCVILLKDNKTVKILCYA